MLDTRQLAGVNAVFGGVRAGQPVGEVVDPGLAVGFGAGEEGLFHGRFR